MHTPSCPRCGYELTGLLASYKKACPTEAVCSECGCPFNWTAVASPTRGPLWFAERIGRGAIHRAFRTDIKSLSPWSFWRHLKMEHTIRPRGIADALVASVVLLLIWSAVVHAVMILISQLVTTNFNLSVWTSYYPLNASWPVGDWGYETYGMGFIWYSQEDLYSKFLPSLIFPFVTALAIPILYLLPVSTRASQGVRVAHVFRISLYGLFGLGTLLLLVVSTRAVIFVLMDGFYNSNMGIGPDWLHVLSRIWCHVLSVLVIVVTVVWQTIWWTVATRQYLRFDRPGSFAWPLLGVSLFAGLVGLVVMATYAPETVPFLFSPNLW